MNFLDNVHAILISLCIAILLPITVYWGVSSVYSYPDYKDFKKQHKQELVDDETPDQQAKIKVKKWQEAKKPFNNAIFYSATLIGILLVIIGSYSAIKTLSIGLIAGGIFNVLMGLCFNPGIALLNFAIVFLVLMTIIFSMIIKNKD